MPHPRLAVTDSTGSRFVNIDKPIFTIGRRSSADLHINNTDVSKEHAEIIQEGAVCVLRDRGSRFGTYVNGERITERALLRGDKIRLSRLDGVELIFENPAPDSTLGLLPTGAPDLRQMAAIMDGLRALGSGRVLADVLTLVLDSALETTSAERGLIMLANADGELEFTLARRRGGEAIDGSFAISETIPPEVFQTGIPCIVDDLDVATVDRPKTRAIGIRRIVCVPLHIAPVAASAPEAPATRIIGVLYLDNRLPARTDSRPMLQSLEAFATQAALAIESARLYAEAVEKARLDRDLRVAADIQRSLLAHPAYAGPTCELAAVSIPCRTIGGDFFDYLEVADGRFVFGLGDVAGKGPPAALLATALQSNFVAYASLGGDAAETTKSINAALLRRPIEARFATMFYGVLTTDGKLSYCNAGHEPPCVIGKNGVRWLEEGGPVLGLFSTASYASETIQLAEHDLVLICSDGVTEAASVAGEEFGRSRIADIVAECQDQRAEAVLEHLVAAVRAFSLGAPQADDITVMAIRIGQQTI
jgi:serine phosphatase RsbU (regulator of sigma subunit)